MVFRFLLVCFGLLAISGTANAACTAPAGLAGEIIYNVDHKVMQFCNDTKWIAMGSSGGAKAAGNNGQIQFNNGSDNLSASSDLFWNNTSKRLGVGTSSPNWKLHVRDEAAPVIQMEEGEFSSSTFIGMDTESFFIRRNTIGTNDALTIKKDNKVGIGNMNPTEQLDIGAGNIAMGWELMQNTCNPASSCGVNCTGTKRLLGGGCASAAGALRSSNPNPTGTGWTCGIDGQVTSTYIAVYAICANIR